MKNNNVGKFILGGAIGSMIAEGVVLYLKNKTVKDKSQKVDKFKGYYNMLNQWLSLKNEGKSLEKYFIDNGYRTIAIYGMGEMGNRLYEELKNSGITVKYAIDKEADNTYSELEVVDMNDDLEEVDAIIISAVFAFDEIREELSAKVDYPVISLEDVVYEI